MLFYWPMLLYPYYRILQFFIFSFFLSIGWYCRASVFGLIGCISLTHSRALTTSFNDNNNNNNKKASMTGWGTNAAPASFSGHLIGYATLTTG